MKKDAFLTILRQVGDKLGLSDLNLDADGFCTIAFDNELMVTIQFDEEHSGLLIFGQLGKIDPEREVDLYPKLLKANYVWQGTGGGTIGVDDSTHEAILSYKLVLEELSGEQFYEMVEGFVNLVELWKKNLGLYQEGMKAMAKG